MSLHKVHDFIAANESQKGIIARKENTDSDIAVKIKGNFCRGIPQEKEKEEEDEPKSYLEQFEAWVNSKFETKEEEESDKKNDDKKVEDEDRKDEKADEKKDEKTEEDKKEGKSD